MTAILAERLASVFVEVADTLVADFDVVEFLHLVTIRTSELVGASAAGVLLADPRGRMQFMAASDERATFLELFQVQADDGPCLEAFSRGEAVVNADLSRAGSRWPRFAPRAVSAGYRSVHAFPLRLRDELIGAMGLFGTEEGRMDPDDLRIVQGLADVVTIGLLQQRAVRRGDVLSEQLQAALDSRVAIEQAKGALAQLRGVSVDEAFDLLRSYCRNNQLRLGDVAHAVATGSSAHPGLTTP